MKPLSCEHYVRTSIEAIALERRLLTRAQFEKMLQAKDFGQLHTILESAGYRHFPVRNVEEVRFHAMLDEFLADFLDEVLAISPPGESEYLDLLFLDYDIHNIQTALMQRRGGVSAVNHHIIPLPRHRAGRYTAPLAGAEAEDDFYTTLLRQAEREFAESPRAAREWLDREYFRRLVALATETGIPMFLEYAQTKVDFYNLLSLLRLRRMHAPAAPDDDVRDVYASLIAPGGTFSKAWLLALLPHDAAQIRRAADDTKYRNVLAHGLDYFEYKNDTSHLERDMDNYLTRLVAARRYAVVGPEPLFGYLYARRLEMVNLRLILAVRLQGLPEAAARERLREEYV